MKPLGLAASAARVAFALGALAVASAGCACPDASVVLVIEQRRYDALARLYGTEALPDSECNALCGTAQTPPDCTNVHASGGTGAIGGAGATGGSAAAGGSGQGDANARSNCASYRSFAYVSECQLALLDWTRPAVICHGTVPCN